MSGVKRKPIHCVIGRGGPEGAGVAGMRRLESGAA